MECIKDSGGELVETIDSLQYDEMIGRAMVAEERLVMMQAEMHKAEGAHLLSQMDTAFQTLA